MERYRNKKLNNSSISFNCQVKIHLVDYIRLEFKAFIMVTIAKFFIVLLRNLSFNQICTLQKLLLKELRTLPHHQALFTLILIILLTYF